ncbi:MAG: hypothetical protein ACKOFP_15840, partial [Actinomycetota bacterium]
MDTLDLVRIVLGTAIIVACAALAARRILFLQGLVRSGQPAVGRTSHVGRRAELEGTQVLGQKKLLQWVVPGVAHVFAFWGFLVLGLTILEAYGALFREDFGVPIVGTWPVIGFLEDLFGILVLIGIAIFATLRLLNNPAEKGRESRFFGSHTSGAWLI